MAEVGRSLKPLEFIFEGQLFRIEFVRGKRAVRTEDGGSWPAEIESTFPYTTVQLMRHRDEMVGATRRETHIEGWEIYRTATVGCWHKEPHGYTHEVGRLRALRQLCRTLPPTMKPLVFEAYFSRKAKG